MGASASAAFTVVAGALLDGPALAMTVQRAARMAATVVLHLLVHRDPEAGSTATRP